MTDSLRLVLGGLEVPWCDFGGLGASWERSWGPLGSSWAPLGAFLEPLGALLGGFLGPLGPSWERFGWGSQF